MADGIKTSTDPTGPLVATDEVTRNATLEHQQVVKVSLGREGQHDKLLNQEDLAREKDGTLDVLRRAAEDNVQGDTNIILSRIEEAIDTQVGYIDSNIPQTDTAPATINGRLARLAQNITSMLSSVVGLLTQSDFDTKVGSLTETTPGSDNASSGLNGRLQWVAQRLTSIIALLPTWQALADGMSNPTVPQVGAHMMGYNSAGTWDRAKLASMKDMDTSSGTEYAVGVSLRKSASGGSVEYGTLANPFRTDTTASTTQPTADSIAQDRLITLLLSQQNSEIYLQELLDKISKGLGVSIRPQDFSNVQIFPLVTANTTNATVIKASAGVVVGWFLYNSNAAARKVMFHDQATPPTAGTGGKFPLTLPPTAAANIEWGIGIPFRQGISITTVTGLAMTDATAVAANDIVGAILYI